MPSDERIVSESVVGSSNPVARFGRKFSDSVSGIFFGLILIAIGFGLVWFGERQKEYSKDVAAIPMVTTVASVQTGMVKVQAVPVASPALVAPLTSESVVYYTYKKEEYRKVKETRNETRTVQQNGQDVQQTVQRDVYVDKWVDVGSDKKWATFSVGGAAVDGTGASLSYIKLKKLYEKEQPAPVGGEVQKTREVVEGIPTSAALLVVGEVANGAIKSGTPFIITDKSNDELLAAMQSSESWKYWGFKIAAWLLMTIGFVMLFGPITTLLNILPGLGSLVSGVLFLVFGILSAIIVLLGTVVIRYWWAVLGVLILLVIGAVVMAKRKGSVA